VGWGVGGGVCVCVCVCVCVGVHCPLVATEGAALTRQTYMHEYTKINH
jgi:glutaminase